MEDFLIQLKDIVSIYQTNDIYILGKGPSLDDIDQELLMKNVVIGINDVERVAPVDITVFKKNWVEQGLAESNFCSRLYVTDHVFDEGGSRAVVFSSASLTEELSALMMQRYMEPDIYIEDVLFVTALKIAKFIAGLRGAKQTVYMVGFDFDSNLGQSIQLGRNFAPKDSGYLGLPIKYQEEIFKGMLYFLENTELSVKHVGNNSYSQLTANQLNHKVQKKDKLESVNRVLVVAELTTNHFGDRLRLEKMIRSSKAAGADYIKLQKRDVETFYSSQQLKTPYLSPFGKTFADYRHQLELSIDDFEFVSKLCRELNIGWFCSVLDQNSFNFIKELNPSIIKLPSTISEHEDYLRYVSNNFRGGIILSTGMTDENYEKFVLENFKQCEELYLLQCNSAYPTPMYDCNIGVVRHYHELSLRYKHIRPGYSSHDIGWLGSALAVAAGAKMLEKHVKYGSTEWAHFDGVAVDLSTNDFKNYVDKIRDVELVVGSGKKAINKSEHHKYRRKS